VLEIRTTDEAIEALYDLNVGVIGTPSGRHERPHKPVLLLAVLDLISAGRATAEHVPWSPELRERFSAYFEVVRRENDQNTPENPFFYLKGDGFWQPLIISGGDTRPLENTPTVAQANAGTVFAKITAGMETFLRAPEDRLRLREALVARYFPTYRLGVAPLFAEYSAVNIEPELLPRAAEEAPDYVIPGRSPAFRRIVLEVYDFQCAACGLRIKLPDADLTFVDGAHLIPFQHSRNDHPTNGLALCKNHHWAMDRFLLVPTPDRIWKVSPRLDARRSPGEEALMQLHGQPVLPPHDDAFLPDPLGLAWRAERIYA
jgi:putative restriction endonuclease